jgi:hypothetical protein
MSLRRREPSPHNNASWDLKREKRGVCTWLMRLLPLHPPSPLPWLTCARRRHWRACSFSPHSPLLLPLDGWDHWRHHQWRSSKCLNFKTIASSLDYNMQRRACASSIVQKYKETKVEMYKPIWGLMFKCNGSGIQFKLIQFSQEYSNQRNVRKEK